MNPTAYIETSVVSYLTARPSRDLVIAAYQQITREWWRDAPRRFELVTSELVVSEAAAGDVHASRARLKMLEDISLLGTNEETQARAEKLLDVGAIPPRAADDAAHIAIAVTNGVDYLVTWNFRHIANAIVRSTIEHVCRAAGYKPPVVCTPNELLEDRAMTDAVIDELRAVREEHAARHGYDIKSIFREIRAREEASGRVYVRNPPRRIDAGPREQAGDSD